MIQQRAVDGIDDASCVSSAKRKLEKLASACVLAGSAGTARAIGEFVGHLAAETLRCEELCYRMQAKRRWHDVGPPENP